MNRIQLFVLMFVFAAGSLLGAEQLSVSFTTTAHGGGYGPDNVVGVWVVGPFEIAQPAASGLGYSNRSESFSTNYRNSRCDYPR